MTVLWKILFVEPVEEICGRNEQITEQKTWSHKHQFCVPAKIAGVN